MEMQLYDMAEVLAKREQRLGQLKSHSDRLEYNANKTERYLRMFGICISETRHRRLRDHLYNLLTAHRHAVDDYNAAIKAPLSTYI